MKDNVGKSQQKRLIMTRNDTKVVFDILFENLNSFFVLSYV
jgi:hypothetical protein